MRTVADDHGLRISFGSCRCAYPNEPPWTLTKDEDPEGRGHDALRALALRMRDQEPDEWPHLLLMLGDQVYADEVAPATEEFIRARRDVDVPPGLQISDFQEYCRLYRDAWCEPAVRWLLSTVPTAMIFDDHDVIDDWNTSRDWVAKMRATGWWDERIVGAFMSYWCYQHLGNLSPEDREEDACYRAVRAADGDAGRHRARLRLPRRPRGGRRALELPARHRAHAHRDDGLPRRDACSTPAGARWSTPRSGTASRSGRAATSTTCCSGTSLPVFLGRGMHYLEAWNEAVADGAWGALASARGRAPAPGPRPRALGRVRRLAARARAAAGRHRLRPARRPTGERRAALGRRPPRLRRRGAPDRGQPAWQAPVYQAVCSPLRNPLDSNEKRAIKFALTSGAERVGRGLARAAGVEDEPLTWEIAEGPWFDNQLGTLELDGRRCTFRLEKALGAGNEQPRLQEVAVRRLA